MQAIFPSYRLPPPLPFSSLGGSTTVSPQRRFLWRHGRVWMGLTAVGRLPSARSTRGPHVHPGGPPRAKPAGPLQENSRGLPEPQMCTNEEPSGRACPGGSTLKVSWLNAGGHCRAERCRKQQTNAPGLSSPPRGRGAHVNGTPLPGPTEMSHVEIPRTVVSRLNF